MKSFLFPLVALLVVSGSSACTQPPAPERQAGETSGVPDELQQAVLSYLSGPSRFTNDTLLAQLNGVNAELQLYDLSAEMIYFSAPSEGFETNGTLGKLSRTASKAEFGQLKEGHLYLGDLRYNVPGRYFFRFPAADFVVDPNALIRRKFSRVIYALTAAELADFIANRSVYGGKLDVQTGRSERGLPIVFSNHGAFVAKPGTASLARLAEQIMDPQGSNEAKAQQLLDFVTNEMDYNEVEAYLGVETLKRPNEVLLTGNSDCSGLAILYASLLEQAGVPYILLYFGNEATPVNHIAVGVHGDFGNENGLGFVLGSQNYSIAEVTVRHFRIGRSRLVDQYQISDATFMQDPRRSLDVFDAKTGKPAKSSGEM